MGLSCWARRAKRGRVSYWAWTMFCDAPPLVWLSRRTSPASASRCSQEKALFGRPTSSGATCLPGDFLPAAKICHLVAERTESAGACTERAECSPGASISSTPARRKFRSVEKGGRTPVVTRKDPGGGDWVRLLTSQSPSCDPPSAKDPVGGDGKRSPPLYCPNGREGLRIHRLLP